jgi:lipopolysaccharide/colanic/teichoic acid biosynthesis glycosyltransferase
MSDATTLAPQALSYGGTEAQAALPDVLLGGGADGGFALRHMVVEDRPQPRAPGRSSRLLKRTFDLLGASLMLVLFAPLLVLVALIIRLEDRGPVLFRQTRVGRDGKPFEILKFRTMVVGADALKDELRCLNEAGGLFKIADDPRVTRVGSFVRRSCIDELPQLLNVLSGTMSLVGPRPLIPEEDRLIVGWHRARLHTAPGMTGHWQVLGGARVPLHEMVAIDCRYVANWTIWSDIRTLARTVPCVLAMRGM